MNRESMNPEQVRQTGLDALAKALGPVGMVRFLQQYESGSGDYSVDRHAWLDGGDVASLAATIRRRRAGSERPEGSDEVGGR